MCSNQKVNQIFFYEKFAYQSQGIEKFCKAGNSTINVTLDGEAAARGGELIITDSNGRTIGRNRVDAGQKSVTMSTDRMNSGAYNITLTEKGKKIDNALIIVN